MEQVFWFIFCALIIVSLYIIVFNKKKSDTTIELSLPTIKQYMLSRNDCLFDAVIQSANLTTIKSYQLRQMADSELKKEGLPTFDVGSMAGEQYLNILSLILNRPIHVYKNKKLLSPIAYNDLILTKSPICIEHKGPAEYGHWIAC